MNRLFSKETLEFPLVPPSNLAISYFQPTPFLIRLTGHLPQNVPLNIPTSSQNSEKLSLASEAVKSLWGTGGGQFELTLKSVLPKALLRIEGKLRTANWKEDNGIPEALRDYATSVSALVALTYTGPTSDLPVCNGHIIDGRFKEYEFVQPSKRELKNELHWHKYVAQYSYGRNLPVGEQYKDIDREEIQALTQFQGGRQFWERVRVAVNVKLATPKNVQAISKALQTETLTILPKTQAVM